MGARTVAGSLIRGDFGGFARRGAEGVGQLEKGIYDWWTGKDTSPPPGELPAPPSTSPDFSDPFVRDAYLSEKFRLKAGRGRRSTFLTGPDGVAGPAPITTPKLGRG